MHGSLRAWNSMIQVSRVGQYLGSLRGILEFSFGGAHGFSAGLKKISSCHDKRGIKISMHVFLLKPGS